MRFKHLIDSIKETVAEETGIKASKISKPLKRIKSGPTFPKKAELPTIGPTGAKFGGSIHEQTLIETIKKLAKDKNCKCDKNDGDNPKGAPKGFELNPEINSSIQNR